MRQFVQHNFISLAIAVLTLLTLAGAGLSFYNKQVITEAIALKNQTEMVKFELDQVVQNITQMDVSGRGFAHIPEDRFLYYRVTDAREAERVAFHQLDSLLNVQGYRDPAAFEALRREMDAYIRMFEQMIAMVQEKNLEEYKALLAEDRGDHFLVVYKEFSQKLTAYEEKLNHEAKERYEAAMARNSLIQVLILLIGLPTLGLVFRKLQKEARTRKELLLNVERNNQQYLFNTGRQAQGDETKDILENSIQQLRHAANFVTHISEGNYDVEWQGLSNENKALNEHNLAGKLAKMRDQMKKLKLEDEKRLWTTEGLAQFSEIIRNHQHNLADLAYQSLFFLTKYLNAQQGSLFVVREEETGQYLELAACYAFEKKKFLEKRVDIGQGLVGQTYRERETLQLMEIPPGYTFITSGLGEATPHCLLIVPFQYNDQVPALIELAGFQRFESHQIAFLEKAGEFVASAVASAQTNEKTNVLLDQFRLQTEQLRAQEEELRQNMEELEATQENMRRNNQLQPSITVDSAPQPREIE